jgi:SacI homology domain
MTTMKRRSIFHPQIFPTFAVSVLSCLLLVAVSSRKVANNGSPANKVTRHATIVSGYGSQRHPLPVRLPVPIQLSLLNRNTRAINSNLSNTASLHQPVIFDDDAPLFVQPSFSMHTKDRSNTSSIRVHCKARNITLLMSVAKLPRDESWSKGVLQKRLLPISNSLNVTKVLLEELSQNLGNEHESNWIPVEGLFGMYILPSGFLLVWVVKSEPIYNAPPISAYPGETNITRSNWWEIYRVSELHLTHIGFSGNKTAHQESRLQPPVQNVFSRNHRLEERRQLTLLRQALKDHDWYYCKSDCGIVPDMTRNLQSCVMQWLPNVMTSNSFISPENSTRTVTDDSIESQSLFDDFRGKMSGEKLLHRWRGNNMSHHSSLPESHFFWNEVAIESLVNALTSNDSEMATNFEVLLEHCIPITSAFCGVRANVSISDGRTVESPFRYDQILISRRSRFRAGTRFTRRGADATGAVANFAETEQILVVWNHAPNRSCGVETTGDLHSVMSFVQTRGSIPLRWSSPTDIKTYRPRVRIGTDPLAQARALQQHLIDQGTKYIRFPGDLLSREVPRGDKFSQRSHPSLLLVNLVDKTSDQGRLGRALDAVLKAVLEVHKNDPNCSLPWLNKFHIQHFWFDFHAEVKSGRWDRLVGLVEEVKPVLIGQDYFAASPRSFEQEPSETFLNTPFHIDHLQTGVIRTNCMDCLDRTNVIQTIFGRCVLFQQLADLKATNLPFSYKMAFRKSPLKLPWVSGEIAHRYLWADNADAISRLYAGTPALKGDFTRTGKRTKKGALNDGVNSLQRYYLNNFFDADRQEGIDLLTGSEFFSYVNELPESGSETISYLNKIGARLSIQEAALQASLGTFNVDEPTDSDRGFVRIKYKKHGHFTKSIKGVGSRSSLVLRWLPGDLQSQFRNLILHSSNMSIDVFRSNEQLQAIDNRATSDFPWWVTYDLSDAD